MRDPLSLPSLKFQQSEQPYLKKRFPAQHTNMPEQSHFETSKNGQVGANWGREKGKGLKKAMDAALRLEAHGRDPSKEGKNQTVASVPCNARRKETQWAFLQEWAV